MYGGTSARRSHPPLDSSGSLHRHDNTVSNNLIIGVDVGTNRQFVGTELLPQPPRVSRSNTL